MYTNQLEVFSIFFVVCSTWSDGHGSLAMIGEKVLIPVEKLIDFGYHTVKVIAHKMLLFYV